MPCNRSLAIVLFLVSSKAAAAGGGTLVGNGAGLVEQNISYSYMALPRAIDSCLAAAAICALSPDQATVLKKVGRIAAEQPATEQRIRFVSETASPGFFETEAGQAQRIAKTGDQPGDSIYWNSDLLYRADGSPALDLPALSALWVHELGHQAGVADHEYLDQLGAKVRLLLSTSTLLLPYSDETSSITLTAYNYGSPTARPTVLLSDGANLAPLGSTLDGLVKCDGATSELLGWTITNLRWDSRRIRNSNGTSYLPMTAWVKVHCLEDGRLVDVDRDLHAFLAFRTEEGKTRFWEALTSNGQGD